MRERATPADIGVLRIGRVRLITARTAAIVPTALMVAIGHTARRHTIADIPHHARTVLPRVDTRRRVATAVVAAITAAVVAVDSTVAAEAVVASTAVEVADTVVEAAVTTNQFS